MISGIVFCYPRISEPSAPCSNHNDIVFFHIKKYINAIQDFVEVVFLRRMQDDLDYFIMASGHVENKGIIAEWLQIVILK
jgi:hypothetical protein